LQLQCPCRHNILTFLTELVLPVPAFPTELILTVLTFLTEGGDVAADFDITQWALYASFLDRR
jgi:hypothetical protein